MADAIVKHFSLDEELHVAAELLLRGFAEQRVPPGQRYPASTRRSLVMLYLSGGFEKLLKCAIVSVAEALGQPLSMRDLRTQYSHDLEKVLDDLLPMAYTPEMLRVPDLAWGRAYLGADPLWRERLSLLGAFAQQERFYDLDQVAGHVHPDGSPERRWGRQELNVGLQLFGSVEAITAITGKGDGAAYFEPVLGRHAQIFEHAAYALARIFAAGPVGQDAKRMSGAPLAPLRRLGPEQSIQAWRAADSLS